MTEAPHEHPSNIAWVYPGDLYREHAGPLITATKPVLIIGNVAVAKQLIIVDVSDASGIPYLEDKFSWVKRASEFMYQKERANADRIWELSAQAGDTLYFFYDFTDSDISLQDLSERVREYLIGQQNDTAQLAPLIVYAPNQPYSQHSTGSNSLSDFADVLVVNDDLSGEELSPYSVRVNAPNRNPTQQDLDNLFTMGKRARILRFQSEEAFRRLSESDNEHTSQVTTVLANLADAGHAGVLVSLSHNDDGLDWALTPTPHQLLAGQAVDAFYLGSSAAPTDILRGQSSDSTTVIFGSTRPEHDIASLEPMVRTALAELDVTSLRFPNLPQSSPTPAALPRRTMWRRPRLPRR